MYLLEIVLLYITEKSLTIKDKIFPATPIGTNIGKYISLIPSPVEEKITGVRDSSNGYKNLDSLYLHIHL